MELSFDKPNVILFAALFLLAAYTCTEPVKASLIPLDASKATSKYRYPPGPRGLPILGVAHLIPNSHPGPTFSQWADKYGEMMTVQLGGLRWVWCNSSRVAKEILERRSAVGPQHGDADDLDNRL